MYICSEDIYIVNKTFMSDINSYYQQHIDNYREVIDVPLVKKSIVENEIYRILYWKVDDNKYCIECFEGNYKVFSSVHSETRHEKTLRKIKLLYTSSGKDFKEQYSGEIKDYHN